MKKYPKILAEMNVLADTIQYLYERAEQHEETMLNYKDRIASGENAEWLKDAITEHEAKMTAYMKLAEKISK